MAGRTAALLASLLLLGALLPRSGRCQSMSQLLDRLFVFGEGDTQLFLGGSAGIPSTQVHGDHFIPAETEANAALLEFFENAMATRLASFPLASTVSSETFELVGGVPEPTSTSFGPIYAERAQTIGRGRLNAGLNYSRLRFSKIRGVDLDDVGFTFVHQNVDFPGCDAIFETDCSELGAPQFENDVIDLDLDLDIEAEVFAFHATFGATDWLDLSFAVPVVDIDLRGTSLASIVLQTGEEANHFFGGTPESPVLQARSQVSGRTAGVGDIAVRIKVRPVRGESWQLAVVGEARLPTGREEDFLGAGEWNGKGLAVLSGTLSDFSPHLNLGYELRGSELDEDEVEVIAGFDHRLADWATLAVDLLSAFKVGDPALALPEPVRIDAPFPRVVRPTNIPERRDDITEGSVGFKFRTGGGLVVITNVLIPLNDGGLRSGPIPTLGIEYTL